MIKENITTLLKTIPTSVKLIAVSKTKPIERIQEAYETGHLDFGENKVQEMSEKATRLPKDIQWHMIGHLQRNKVKYIAPFVSLIHSVDSVRLLREIDKQAQKNDRIIDCLLQMRIAREETKFGLTFNACDELLQNMQCSHVRIRGLMGMATFSDDQSQLKEEFGSLKNYFDKHKNEFQWDTLSMGMSGDYELAIACGSNMIRVGSRIFGSRN
ncbi:MAG: YggS family pyridoxal phosphate-dependent enzyme [Flavobacteriaceae bacterium]|jgi:pyridoxal phosphate enzyme (YggS family)|nr:YggS family pyridoxal phosphate-dependent enzyme [Flavobacteriaceae bacterium]